MEGGQSDQQLDRTNTSNARTQNQERFALPTGPLQPPQKGPPPHASMNTPATNVSDQVLSSDLNIAHGPSARSKQYSQNGASCRLCRRRKVKCDRAFPCGTCTRGGEECVPTVPSRAPRGRQGGRKRKADKELLERIARLEELVKTAEGNSDDHGTTSRRRDSVPTVDVREGDSRNVVAEGQRQSDGTGKEADRHQDQISELRLARYLGTSFWATLSEEISELRDVLKDSSDEEDEVEEGQTPASSLSGSGGQQAPKPSDSGFIISPTNLADGPGNPTPHQLYTFCETFLTNVDPVLKILHAPSLRKYLQEGAAELDCSPGPEGLEALKFAICYAAALSMTDGECRDRIGEDKVVLMAKYRAGTELALAKADLVNTIEVSTLQAFTIYLSAIRANDTRRIMWTLTSLAVRIAQAMGLHNESLLSSHQPFEQEMRRRLWWQIYILDSHAAEDRGTNPVISAESFNTRLPLHINDEDLRYGSFEQPKEPQGFTDITFCLICYEIYDTIGQLNYVPLRQLGQPQNVSQGDWAKRIDAVVNTQRRVEERYLRHLKLSRPFHWTTSLIADIMSAIMWLFVYRPLQRHSNSSFSSHLADPGILGLSLEVLERGHQINTDPAASPYRWLSQTYVNWHPLAVTIAELCVKFEGPMVERAWAVLVPVFEEASQHIADTNEGMLWRPIKKLMHKAQRLRQDYLNSLSTRADVSAGVAKMDASGHATEQAGSSEPDIGMLNDIQQSTKDFTPTMEGLQPIPLISSSVPLDWDPWLAAAASSMEPSIMNQYNDDVNQMAWTNWETFVDGFQGQDQDVLPSASGIVSGQSSIWP